MPSSKLAKNRELDVTLLEQAICLPQLFVRYIFEIHMICTLWHLQEYGIVICLMDTRRLSNELSLKTNFVTLDNGLVPKANNLLIEQRNEVTYICSIPLHMTVFITYQSLYFGKYVRLTVCSGLPRGWQKNIPRLFPDNSLTANTNSSHCRDIYLVVIFLQYIENHIEISSFINRCFNIVVLEIGQHKRTFSTSWKVSISGISPTFP